MKNVTIYAVVAIFMIVLGFYIWQYEYEQHKKARGPPCPTNTYPENIGYVWVSGQWNPIYTCVPNNETMGDNP